MKLLSAVAMLIVLAACQNGCSGNPAPNPTPTPPPNVGYNCADKPELSGVVKVDEPIEGKFIIVLKDQAPSERARMQPMLRTQDVKELKVLRQGFSARMSVAAVQRALADPNVAYVQEDGKKSIHPKDGGPASSWGLDRVDQARSIRLCAMLLRLES